MKPDNLQPTYYQLIMERFNNLIMKEIGNQQLNIDFICQRLAMSKSKLYRIVKQTTGKSVKSIIREKRMDYAIKLLQTGNSSITDIAMQVGYSNISAFSKAFRRTIGMYPSEFVLNR